LGSKASDQEAHTCGGRSFTVFSLEHTNVFRLPTRILALVVCLALLSAQTLSAITRTTLLSKSTPHETMVYLPGHVLPALARATAVKSSAADSNPMTLTMVLNRNDQAGFDRYLRDVYDSHSTAYRHFLTPLQISDRFGPSQESYNAVLRYLQGNGLKLVEASANRMTITVHGTRAKVERAFGVQIGEYRIANKTFYANDLDPALPQKIAPSVQAVLGLSNLVMVHGSGSEEGFGILAIILIILVFFGIPLFNIIEAAVEFATTQINKASETATTPLGTGNDPPSCSNCYNIDGTGPTVGLVEFDTFQISDVTDFLALNRQPASFLSHVSQVHVNGGAPSGPNQNEALLDIDIVQTIAPGANLIVYDAPFAGAENSFQPILNKMINDGVTIISNSWTYCEDQTTQADVNSIDAIFKTAAASGISVFNAAGDSGTSCIDGAPNTFGVPAVGKLGARCQGRAADRRSIGGIASETWWNGLNEVATSGQGGFGVSKFFSRPSYQNGLNASPMWSIPDVSVNADPAHGVLICQASGGECPTGLFNGGTSGGAPTWAAFAALLNQAQGQNLGFLNPLLYPFANTSGFHNAASMGTDFAHVVVWVLQIWLICTCCYAVRRWVRLTPATHRSLLSYPAAYCCQGFRIFPPTVPLRAVCQ
jgi:subtilase family serine protease